MQVQGQQGRRDFGSFHVSNVQELLTLNEEDYQPPKLPFEFSKNSSTSHILFGKDIRNEHFLLEESCTFINHGAFGATLKDALTMAQRWQIYIEGQPLRFFDRELFPHLVHVTRRMAKFVGCDAEDLVLVPNVTTAVNCVVRSLNLQPGDFINILSVEYGAVKKIVEEVCMSKQAHVENVHLDLPLKSEDEIITVLERSLSSHTKLVIIDHIPSNTPYIAPVKKIIDLCHQRNILVLVDGAHALGQLDLDLRSLGADFYTTNCHKWFCGPKGAGLLYVNKQHKEWVQPLVISHGHRSGFNSAFMWSGLRDYSPFLALHSVLDFWLAIGPDRIRDYTHSLSREAASMLMKGWNTELLVPPEMTGSMLCVRLPSALYQNHENVSYSNAEVIQNQLYSKYNIEVPIKAVQGHLHVRISAQMYNSLSEYEKLRDAINEMSSDDSLKKS